MRKVDDRPEYLNLSDIIDYMAKESGKPRDFVEENVKLLIRSIKDRLRQPDKMSYTLSKELGVIFYRYSIVQNMLRRKPDSVKDFKRYHKSFDNLFDEGSGSLHLYKSILSKYYRKRGKKYSLKDLEDIQNKFYEEQVEQNS